MQGGGIILGALYFIMDFNIMYSSLILVYFTDVDIPDDGTDDPYDFKFVRWLCKEKVCIGFFIKKKKKKKKKF